MNSSVEGVHALKHKKYPENPDKQKTKTKPEKNCKHQPADTFLKTQWRRERERERRFE